MTFGKRQGATVLALAVLLGHFASFEVASRPIVTDVRYFLYYAWQVTEGAVPHRDFFENKTQLSTFAGAALFRVGEALGVDPLVAIRAGYLALAALGGLLAFEVFRRLAKGSVLAGLLGLLAYCSFGLLGVLPAVGNLPKLLMAVLASAMALLVHERRWLLAGVAGALAFMDWQVGATVWVAAFGSALLCGPGLRAALAVTGGGVAGMAPFLAYYAAHGALGATFRQVVMATFFRGSDALQSLGVGGRLARIAGMVEKACPQQEWLFVAAFLGLAVIARWLLRDRDPDRNRLLVPLCIHHAGVLGFSLLDFQAYGDFFLLLHSIAFLLGLAWLALLAGGGALVARAWPGSARARALFGVALLLAAVGAGRPGLLRPRLELDTDIIAAGGTLADQQEVADALAGLTAGRTLVLMDSSELLFLMRHRNPLPMIYWNRATRALYGGPPGEPPALAAWRLLRSVDPDAFIEPPVMRRGRDLAVGYRRVELPSTDGRYAVELRVRWEADPGAGRSAEPTASEAR